MVHWASVSLLAGVVRIELSAVTSIAFLVLLAAVWMMLASTMAVWAFSFVIWLVRPIYLCLCQNKNRPKWLHTVANIQATD